jgi:drug/metabolite transporter (DMT)-like permease
MTALGRAAHAVRIPTTTAWGLALAVGTAVISGVAIWLNAYAVKQVPDPAVYTTLKNAVAAVVLVALVGASGTGGFRRLDRGACSRLALVGLIGGSIPFLLFFTGLAEATAPGAAFIQKTLFIWVTLLAVPLLGVRLGAIQVVAIGVLLAGQAVLAPPRLDGAGWGAGETMILAATLLWAVEVIIAKRLLATVPVLIVGAGRLGIGVLFLLGYLAATGSLGAILEVSATGWAWVAVTGLVLAAYVGTWFAALRRAPAGAVASVLVLGAVITSALQAISNGAAPTGQALTGGVLLVAAAAAFAIVTVRRARVGTHTAPV